MGGAHLPRFGRQGTLHLMTSYLLPDQTQTSGLFGPCTDGVSKLIHYVCLISLR